jgi:hypothetical protein
VGLGEAKGCRGKLLAAFSPFMARSLDDDMIPLGKYRHFKGNEYEVIGVAKHSETQEPHVVYRPLYDDSGLWIRPLSMFTETVERDGTVRPRFEYIGPMG